MSELDKELVQILEDKPVEILKRGKALIRDLKKENGALKKQIEILLRNNKTLVELVEVLENKMRKIATTPREKYVYDYHRGGWVQKESLEKGKIEIEMKDLDLKKINLQLEEIVRLMKFYKERNLREE